MDNTQIEFGGSSRDLLALSDSEFLQAITWRRTAARSLRQTARSGDVEAFGELLRQCTHLHRANTTTQRKLQGPHPLLWSQSACSESPRLQALQALWESSQQKRTGTKIGPKGRKASRKKRHGRLENLLDEWNNQLDGSPISPLETLLLLDLLTHRTHRLPAGLCWKLWRAALTAVVGFADLVHAQQQRNSDENQTESIDRAPDQWLLTAGELPWQAGLLFSAVKGAAGLRRSGRDVLRRDLMDRTDTDGTPSADLLERFPFWLAPLVRSADLANQFDEKLWDAESAGRFRLLIGIIAPWCRSDGRMALGNGFKVDALPLLRAAASLAGWKKKSPPMRYLSHLETARGGAKTARQKTARWTDSGLEAPVTQSDWAQLACLRSDWSPSADVLIVAHHRRAPQIDLSVLGKPLLSGSWDITVAIDGEPLDMDGEWTCVCWFSDDDADYLELQQTIGDDGPRIERQVLLSRTNRFALLADTVFAAGDVTVDYLSRLPVCEGIETRPDRSTRECELKGRGLLARVFPLALPSERVFSTAGALGPAEDGTLELRQTAIGGVYAPLVLDWHPQRRKSVADWRTLTITEQGTVVKSNRASGHRLRIGDQHLFVYHALAKTDIPRAVLGQHTAHETLIGTLDEAGDVEPILLVE